MMNRIAEELTGLGFSIDREIGISERNWAFEASRGSLILIVGFLHEYSVFAYNRVNDLSHKSSGNLWNLDHIRALIKRDTGVDLYD